VRCFRFWRRTETQLNLGNEPSAWCRIPGCPGLKLPQEKASFISALQQQGQLVAMVGDGINDAPALVQADLAIAVHSGSNLGKEAADLTLMRGDLLQLWDFFSFIYNLVSIPIAMSGLLSPLLAVCAMLLSSLSVIGNTLLLLKKT
jgi:P-type E1-E2 ATPase